ncbi:hypothetical protein [Streptomyces sp. NPDC052042]|uniref:hypothetical protein n=1 Tax=Streptomyces sp. NPDC052042 TaxID=3365683 RepID=UPI0037CF7AB4
MSTEAQRPPVPPRPTPVPPGAAPPAARPLPLPHPAAPPVVPGPQIPPPVPPRHPAAAPVPPVTPAPPPAPARFPYGYGEPFPETPAETTTRLRPVRTRRPARVAAAAMCVVLGLGLIGGAATGAWLTSDSSADSAARSPYTVARSAWRGVPVDTLFPRTLDGRGAGPGGADRVWTRIAVAPDGGCAPALDPLLARALSPVGCERLLRATYTDATASAVTTVGMIFTEGDAAAMTALRDRFADQRLDRRADLMPRTYPVDGTPAAGFGDRQRAAWSVRVATGMPVVVFSVSGFADGRPVGDPRPAARAAVPNARGAVAEAGLGHEARGVADRIERVLRRAVTDFTENPR